MSLKIIFPGKIWVYICIHAGQLPSSRGGGGEAVYPHTPMSYARGMMMINQVHAPKVQA